MFIEATAIDSQLSWCGGISANQPSNSGQQTEIEFSAILCSSTLVETMRFQRKTFSCYTLLLHGRSRAREK